MCNYKNIKPSKPSKSGKKTILCYSHSNHVKAVI